MREDHAAEDLEQSQVADEPSDGEVVATADVEGEHREQADAAAQASAADSSSDAGDAEERVGAGDPPA